MLTAKLTLKTGSREKTFDMYEGRPLFAGRTVECDLYLPAPAVSRRHAVFMARGGKCGIKDLESSNGTYLNGERITKPMRLKHGDIIKIANFAIEFLLPDKERYADAARTVILGGIAPADTPPEATDRHAAAEIHSGATRPDTAPPVAARESAVSAAPPPPPPPPAPPCQSAPIPEAEAPEEAPVRTEEPSPAAVRRTMDTIRRTTKPPPALRAAKEKIETDELGDGAADAAFMADAPQHEDAADNDLALTKKAAEAGLVGEFVPDIPDPAPGEAPPPGEDRHSPGGIPAYAVDFPPPPEPDPYAMPLSAEFRQAVETRLYMYSFLADMKEERDALLRDNPDLPDAVKSEIDRQNREMDKPPPADKAEDMIAKRTARREELKVKIREAKEKGAPLPPRPSKVMRQAEDIAINQWTIISQSLKEALPAAFTAGYAVTRAEPLAGVLKGAGLNGVKLLGGAAYVLALGILLEEAKYNRAFVRAKLSNMTPPEEKKGKDPGKAGGGGLFGRLRKDEDGEDDGGDEAGDSWDDLVQAEKQLGLRAAWLAQESTYVETLLIKEFWEVYTKVALAFLPEHRKMPLSVRAFMRYGVIGFQKWWLKENVKKHVAEDCAKDVVHDYAVSKTVTNVVYADEYLAAVMEMQCTPAMDENLEINERNSPNWKADKALRKLINSRSQSVLLTELADGLGSRVDKLEAESAALDDRIKNLLPGSKNFKAVKNELGQQRQALRVEVSKLTKLRDKIRGETLANLQEVIRETEERFTSGELPRPERDFLITREVEAVRKIGRLLANLKERFLPLVMRENFTPDSDACNDRPSIIGEFADIERRDPGIFLEILIPSKKKANRVELRISPAIVLLPSAGILAFSWGPRQKPEDGRLAIPTCFIRPRLRERQLTYLLSDFRWDTAKASAGMDVMNSDTIVAAFMGVRWDWRKRSKEGREKGLVYTDQNDRTNWRRVYEAYLQTAMDGGKKLYNRNYDFYERIIGKYFDMPEGVELLRK